MPTLFKTYGGRQGGVLPERTERGEISHGLCVCVCNLHPEINLEQSSTSWLQQRWKGKVVSNSNRQSVRLSALPPKETNILDLRYYALNNT